MEVGNCEYGFSDGFASNSSSHNLVWVIVDRMTKSALFFPVYTSYSAEDYAKIYIKELVRLHDVLLTIISDRGTQFTSHLQKLFQKDFGTEVHLSTTFHP